MDGDTQPTRRFDRRLLLLAIAFVLAATAIWASSSLAGGSGPPSPSKAKAKVSQVDRGPMSGGFKAGGTGGSNRRCPFEGHRLDSSDV
jgi:hypothetical protein